jgi:hypothetical protein
MICGEEAISTTVSIAVAFQRGVQLCNAPQVNGREPLHDHAGVL